MSVEVLAQPVFKKTNYAKEQGLSHNTVMGITMDKRGFLWFATMDGLNRFDGLEMKVYRSDESDSNSISDNFIHGIHEHESGNLWISTRDGGLNIFDPVTEKFTLLDSKEAEGNNFPDRQISLLWKDSRNKYWLSFFGHSAGILNSETNQYFPANIVDIYTEKPKTSANSIIEFNDGSLLMCSFNGMYYLPAEEIRSFRNYPDSSTLIKALPVPFSESDPFPNSATMKVDSNGDLWLNITSSGLQKMNKAMIPDFLKESIRSGVSGNSSGNLVVEREGFLISGYVGNKILYVDLQSGKEILKTFDRSSELDGATYLFEDKQGELWVHTWGNGVYKLEQKKGISLINNAVRPGSFETDFMLGFEEDKGGFWIGSAGGVYFYRENEDRIVSLNDNLSSSEVFGIWSMERDHSGLWIATNEKGLVYLSNGQLSKKSNWQSRRFTEDNSFILSKNLHQLLRDSRGWLWLGYEGDGVQILKNPDYFLEGEVADVITLNTNGDEGLNLGSDNIRKFYEDESGDIWISTIDAGFKRILMNETDIAQIQSFTHDPDDINSIPHNDGRNVYQQNDSTYWFATYGGGITKWNAAQNKFKRFTTSNGLPNNSTYSVIAGENKTYVWTSTNSGLARLHAETEEFETYDESDGLQNNEFNTGAYYSLKDGRLLFGGINGLNIIDPEMLEPNKREPLVYITQIELFDEILKSDTAAIFKKELKLPYNQNFLSFRFAALDYENPKQNQFAYKMEGIDQEWVQSANRNFAGYPNLQPGKYIFKVKAANSDGFWNESGASISVIITPPWWKTWWFRTISGIVFIMGLVFSVRYFSQRRLREQIRKMEVENKLRNERERISRDLHDHVGAQLANIMSGLSLVDKYNQVDNKEKSSSLMSSLRGDAEVTIKQLRETIWALNQNSLTLQEFKEHLQSYFNNQTAFKEGMSIGFLIDDGDETQLSSTQALNIFRIIQEASQNTLKYANADNLLISLERKNGSLKVKVKDDGTFKGNQSSFNGGYGFGNMKKRAKELEGKIEVCTEDGTQITVEIPV